MKKTIAILSACLITVSISLFIFPSRFIIAKAEDAFMRVITSDTQLFEDAAMTKPLFCLPYTYYVKILSVEGDAAHVEYAGDFAPAIDGYVKYSALFSDGLKVDKPYPALTVKTLKTAVLYHDAATTENIRYVFPDRELYYYGFVKAGDAFVYCVSYNGSFGYIKEDSVYPFTVSDHPNELTFLKTDEPATETFNTQTENKNNDTFILRIIVIGCLILAGLIAAFAVRKPKKDAYYDENDFS